MNRRQFVMAAAVGLTVLTATGAAMAEDAPPATRPTGEQTKSFDAGAKADITKDGIIDTFAKSHHKIDLVRSNGKIYAMSAVCTHKGCAMTVKEQTLFCKCHRSTFDIAGTPTAGPAKRQLNRYAISTNGDGHLIVDSSKTFDPDHFDDPASFVSVD
jgi:Rieske Fe-S protein